MHNAWPKTFAVLFCVVGLTTTKVHADPAGMAMQAKKSPQQEPSKPLWPWSKKAEPAPQLLPPAVGAERPTDHISPKQHPIKYLKAAVSELPIGKGKGATATHPVMPPAQQRPEMIALGTPSAPPSPEFFIYAAQACERQNDIPQARENFQRALSIWPGQVEVLRAAARMEDRQGNLPLAENLYAQAVNANPQNAGALNDLGLCLARQGKLEASAGVLEQAVQLQPSKALYRNNAATVLVELRQDQRALGHLAAVHGAAEANYNFGQLLVERNRGSEAAPYFQAALQQNPSLESAQEALAKLQPPSASPAAEVAANVSAGAPQVAQAPSAASASAPAVTPLTVPPASPAPPQNGYPATAQAPASHTQGYTPPQYLPPVASRPGETRR